MNNNIILLGLIGSVCIFGYLGLENAIAEPNGTPFIQAEIDAIEEIIQNMQTQLDGIQITWTNLTGKPEGFADNVDNDKLMEISASCTIDQIVKWDGSQWSCADSANNNESGDAARKIDCFLIRESKDRLRDWNNFQDGCELGYLEFHYTDLSYTNLSYATFTGTWLDAVNFTGADFTGANLSIIYRENGADYVITDESIFKGADFTGANLSGMVFYKDNLEGADFTGANLSGAELRGVNLSGAVLQGVNIDDADFGDAILSDPEIGDAIFTDCIGTPYGTPLTGTLPICTPIP